MCLRSACWSPRNCCISHTTVLANTLIAFILRHWLHSEVLLLAQGCGKTVEVLALVMANPAPALTLPRGQIDQEGRMHSQCARALQTWEACPV